jgi:hypothetical protein
VADNKKTIITRIQNRRGLKQDLPNPLRPGEIGFATDTRQIYIGADTSVTSDSFNKTAKFENVIGAKTVTTDLVDDQIIQFTVPHRRFERNYYDGTQNTVSWTPQSSAIADNPSSGTVFKTNETEFRDIQEGGTFRSDITVVKNGVQLSGDLSVDASPTNISSGTDFYFSAGSQNTSTHVLTFRTPPVRVDEIGVSYYSNADVWRAITASTDSGDPLDIGAGGIGITGVRGFHADYGIPEYRYLDQKNVHVAGSTGVGFIGLSTKHIIVATDVKNSPVPVATPYTIPSSALGLFHASRNIQKSDSLPMTSTTNNITINVDAETATIYNNATHLVANLVNTSGWVDGKVLTISSTSSSELIADLPSNAATAYKTVTNVNTNDPSLEFTLTLDSTENVSQNDELYFLDAGNIVGVNGQVGVVSSISVNNVVVTFPTIQTIDLTGGDLYVITRKAGDVNTIVLTSNNHGFVNGDQFTSPGDIGSGIVANANVNTFTTTPATAVTTKIDTVLTPVVANADVYITPVSSIDITGNTSLSGAVTHFNENSDSFELRYATGSDRIVYLTEKENTTKNSTGFRVYDDAAGTASYLNIVPDNYTKADSTVKAKLENWLYSMLDNNNVNMMQSVAVNLPFSNGTAFDTWSIDIDSATDEVRFNSSEEVRNFTSVLNNVYFDSQSNDIRGLLNVKTNIEILTLESQESGDADIIFTAPKGADIRPADGNPQVITDLEVDLTRYDTVFVEYSMQDKSANTDINYKRIGTLHITGESNSGVALIEDNFTDSRSGFTGNVVFTASYDAVGNSVEVTAENDLFPPVDVRLTFVRKSWSTL